MDKFQTLMKADPTDWLLESENPSVRYFARKDLLGLPDHSESVVEAQRVIMAGGFVPEILRLQQEPAYVDAFPRFYTNKYKGLVWQLITLAELGAQANGQIREQCEYILTHSQEHTQGGFSQHAAAKPGGGRLSEVIPCLTGNMVWALIRFGYLDDPRMQRGIEWITTYMRFNDGEETDPQVPPYNHYEMCWGRHTCHMGVVKALKALAAIPEDKRNEAVKGTIDRASEFLLAHHIHKQSHKLKKVSKPGWLKFSFPLMYQTDILEILDILTSLGIRDNRMEEAIRIVLDKQGSDGRWICENTEITDRLLIPFGLKNAPSQWITLRAMRVLKNYFLLATSASTSSQDNP